MNNTDDAIDQVLDVEVKYEQALRKILDNKGKDGGSLTVQRILQKKEESYLAVVDYTFVSNSILYANQIAMFEKYRDSDSEGRTNPDLVFDSDSIMELIQRGVDKSRQAPMTRYLVEDRHAKFAPILLTASDAWVTDPSSDAWDPDGRALRAR